MKNKEYTAAFRIFHWLNAITVFFIVLTVFARKNWLEKYKIRDKIMEYAGAHDITITHEQAYGLAKTVRNEVWDYHYILGFVLAALIVYRLILFFFPGGRKVLNNATGYLKGRKGKDTGLSFLYLAVYLAILISVITGLGMYFYRELGFTKDFKHSLEALHVGVVTLIIYFIPLHLFGVILAELNQDKGLVSRLINGGNHDKKTEKEEER